MHQDIRDRYSETILKETLNRFGIDPATLQPLDGFESYIYAFSRDGGDYILRVGHTLRNSEAFVRGEVDWINYLVEGGVSASRAVPSQAGKLVESIDDGRGGAFLATVFTRAPGGPPQRSMLNGQLYENYGRLLGRIHRLSKDYIPRDPLGTRPLWNDPRIFDVERFLPPSETGSLQRAAELRAWLDTLPRDRDSFGLIHEDAHMGNFFVDQDGTITLFDFDDCNYGWYANDIAIVLFYRVTNHPEPAQLTAEFMPPFLSGYAKENRLDPSWLAAIPSFLKLRELGLYAVLHRSFPGLQEIDSPWINDFLAGRQKNIETGAPYVDFDFTTLARYLGG